MTVNNFVTCVKGAMKLDRGMFYDPKSLICMKYRQVDKKSTATGNLILGPVNQLHINSKMSTNMGIGNHSGHRKAELFLPPTFHTGTLGDAFSYYCSREAGNGRK